MIRRRKKLTGLLVAAALMVSAGGVTFAAYVATTGNSGNRIESGSVRIGDDDANAAMMSFANAQPGAGDESCIVVTYDGSLDSTVRLYGTTGGTGLDPYLDLRVTRGANSSNKYEVTLRFNTLGNGKNATQSFTWEARNQRTAPG